MLHSRIPLLTESISEAVSGTLWSVMAVKPSGGTELYKVILTSSKEKD